MRPAESDVQSGRKKGSTFRRLISSFAVLVTLVFLIGYLGRFVGPNRLLWWVQLVAIPLPYVAIGAGIIALWRLVVGKGIVRRIVPALVLLLLLVRFPVSMFGSGEGYNSDSDLSLLSYNIPAERVRRAENGNDRLSELVAETQANVVALQESYWYYRPDNQSSGRHDVAPLEALGFELNPPVNRAFGAEQVVVTKLPNSGVEYWKKPSGARDPDILAILRSVIEWQGREFAVYNIHLASYGTSKPWHEPSENRFSPRVWFRYFRDYRFAILHRAWQVDQVRELVESEELPYLIVGDFNATPHNWSYWQLAHNLTDAFKAAGRGTGLTYHERRPTFRIDYILVSDEFDVTSARSFVGGVSDHLAVNATLRWKD